MFFRLTRIVVGHFVTARTTAAFLRIGGADFYLAFYFRVSVTGVAATVLAVGTVRFLGHRHRYFRRNLPCFIEVEQCYVLNVPIDGTSRPHRVFDRRRHSPFALGFRHFAGGSLQRSSANPFRFFGCHGLASGH